MKRVALAILRTLLLLACGACGWLWARSYRHVDTISHVEILPAVAPPPGALANSADAAGRWPQAGITLVESRAGGVLVGRARLVGTPLVGSECGWSRQGNDVTRGTRWNADFPNSASRITFAGFGWAAGDLANESGLTAPGLNIMSVPYRFAFIPYWFLVLATGAWPAAWLVRRVRRRRDPRRLPGHCRRCGYDLRATPERCPECGTEVPTADPPGTR